jgi:glycosyltransferase involved in cell wall biosynthesis
MTDTAHSALFVTTVASTLRAFLRPCADHFRAQGWRVDALANGAPAAQVLADHFDSRFDVSWSRNPVDPGSLLGSSRTVRDVVRAGPYDIVHVHTPVAAFTTRFALRALPAAERPVVIYTAHGFHFYRGQGALPHAALRSMERIAAPWTDYLVTINREDYEAAQRLGGIAPNRVRLIPSIGVDVDRFRPHAVPADETAAARRTLLGDAGVDAFLVTMVAEFGAVKRHALALDALHRTTDARIHLALVGEGPLLADVHGQVERLGLGHRVTFAGYRTDIPAVLAATDALLLTSEREGLNRSVLEAMATGKPVIGTDTRGIADPVGADAGWIVGHSDAAALAEALDEAAGSPDEVARRGRVARERVVAEYSLDRVLNEYDGLYREALASHL